MDVGFIGLGMMGRAIAHNIAGAGHSVRAWNRTPVTGQAAAGLDLVTSPKQAFQADVVFTMLSDDAAIREVLLSSNVLCDARPGTVHVLMSTISVELVDELRVRHAEAGIGYVAAPVFGRPDAAAAALLNIIVAGEASALDKARPLLDLIGKKIWVMGKDPKQANAAKIAGNMMITMAIEAMAEAIVLTRSNGLAPEVFFDLVLQTQFGCRVYETYSAKIIKGDFEPGFKMALGLKDLRLAAAAGDRDGKRLPILDAVRARMTDAVEAGMGDKDWSAVADYTLRN
jgi:3-hydroxyisobutyrate dehydrogenase-like beta-hydroxyacid dehydrogenase